MTTLPTVRPGVNSGPDRCARTRTKPIDPSALEGSARRAWERSVLNTPGLRGSRLGIVRALLDEFCWGKASCWPRDATIAKAAGVSSSTVQRALLDLVAMGVIRIIRDGHRRVLVFPSHPSASAALARLERPVARPAHPAEPSRQADDPGLHSDGAGPVKLTTEDVESLNREVETPKPSEPPATETKEISLSANDLTNPPITADQEPDPPLTPKVLNWRTLVPPDAAPPPPPAPARRPSPRRSSDGPVLLGDILPDIMSRYVPDGVETPQERQGGVREPMPVQTPIPTPPTTPAGLRTIGGAVDEAKVIGLLCKLGRLSTESDKQAAVVNLSTLFADFKSARFYRGVINDLAAGKLSPAIVRSAIHEARGPAVRKPAALFASRIEAARGAREEHPKSS